MTQTSPSPVESLTKALVDANDQLVTLYELTSVTMRSLDEQETASTILDRAAQLLQADLRLWCSERRSTSPELDHTTDTGDGHYLHTEALSGAADQHNADSDHSISVKLQSSDGRQAGRLEAIRVDRPFGTADGKLLTAVGNLVSGAINASRLHEAELGQAMVARDHDTASALARRALPTWRPSINGLEVYAESQPARAAGGDLFCFSIVDNTVHFAVGDVSGKGLPAAMMMTTVISASTAAFQGSAHAGAAAAMTAVDAWVYEYLAEAGLFVTLVVGQFDTITRRLSLVNAGHSPVLIVQGGEVTPVLADIAPVGVLPVADGPDLVAQNFTLGEGDRFIICSDGLTEQENPSGEMVGEDHLIEAVQDTAASAHQIGPQILEYVEKFADGYPQADDRTLVIFEFTPRRDAS